MKRWKIKQTPKTKTWHAIDPRCPLEYQTKADGCRCEFFGSLPAAHDYAALQARLDKPLPAA